MSNNSSKACWCSSTHFNREGIPWHRPSDSRSIAICFDIQGKGRAPILKTSVSYDLYHERVRRYITYKQRIESNFNGTTTFWKCEARMRGIVIALIDCVSRDRARALWICEGANGKGMLSPINLVSLGETRILRKSNGGRRSTACSGQRELGDPTYFGCHYIRILDSGVSEIEFICGYS